MSAPTEHKVIKALVDGLSDVRTNVSAVVTAVVNEAARNDHVQLGMWKLVVGYLYHNTSKYDLGLCITPNEKTVGRLSSLIVHRVLEDEYHVYGDIQDQVLGGVIPIDLTEWDVGE